jgi:ribosomal protein S18 acetylase RimI-like enzyme
MTEIRPAATVEELVAAEHLFDHAVKPEWAQRFLDQADHHLFLAYVDGYPAGFISGVETIHPDKGKEMFLYELGVDEGYRRRGIGRALVERLAVLARERDCYGMWVPVDVGNDPAVATYRSGGGVLEHRFEMLSWTFSG